MVAGTPSDVISAELAAPELLPPNLLRKFFAGGASIARFRNLPALDSHLAEDWLGSAATARGQTELGLSRFSDGTLVRDRLRATPEAYFSHAHRQVFGADPAMLVKLLDTAERLPIAAHPDRAFASTWLDSCFGKTEAWLVLETAAEDAFALIGFREDVSFARLRELVEKQQADELSDLLNKVRLEPGDAILVPGGTPHALGPGLFIVEVQEPTDFSVMLEWKGYEFDGPRFGHLMLGFERALGCVDRSAWDSRRLEGLRSRFDLVGAEPAIRDLLPPVSRTYFRAQAIRCVTELELEQEFSVLVVLSGEGSLEANGASSLPLSRGSTALVPYAAERVRLCGDLGVLRCLPPEPTTQSHVTEGSTA